MTLVAKSSPPVYEYNDAVLRRYNLTNCTAGGGYGITTTNQLAFAASSSWMEGQTISNFRQKVRRGDLLPMTHWKQYRWVSRGSLSTRQYCDGANRLQRWEGKYFTVPTGSWLLPSWEELYSHLPALDLQYFVQQAAARISSGGWDALTFVAEIGQLRRMLKGILTKMESLSRGASPGKLHDLWLEGRYGWRTLMYDIQDFNQAVSRLKEERTRYSEKAGLTTSLPVSESTSFGNPTISEELTGEIRVSQRGCVVADIEVPVFQISPFRTAWEVTRLSFVVDWLINVGQALDSLSFLLNAKRYVASGGFRVDFNLLANWSAVPTLGFSSYVQTGSWSAEGHIEQRLPMTVSSLPRLKLRLDEWKIIDLISLIRQRL